MQLNILIVDDEPEIRFMTRRLLSAEGATVTEAEHGKAALEHLADGLPVDLVITDIVMPEKEGLETIMELRRKYPDVRILAMSGGGKGSSTAYLELASKMGADAIVKKPFRKAELMAAIQTATEG